MQCLYPLKMYYIPAGHFGYEKEKQIFVNDNSLLPFVDGDGVTYFHSREVPCGQCISCRLNYSRQWANRCMLEARQHDINWFVTLTYDDEHLPFNDSLQLDNYGEIVTDIQPTLVKKDPSAFIKRLRSQLKYHYDFDGLRVFYCGEYGDKTGRPHYHMILFNVPPQLQATVVFLKKSKHGFPLWNVPLFDSCWAKGFCVVGNCTWETCAYTARYIMKKQKGENSILYHNSVIVPEFVNMSRRPGIARDYYEQNSDCIYKYDSIPLYFSGKVNEIKPPKYYDRLFGLDNPDLFEELRKNREKSAKNVVRDRRARTSLSDAEYLQKCSERISSAVAKLVRPDV